MARKKLEKEPEVVDETPAEETEEDKGASVAVYISGQFIRTYSKELHGKDYKKLAHQFAEKVSGREVRPK